MRGKAEIELDDDRQDDRADDASRGGAEVDRDRHEQNGRERDDGNDDRGLHHRFGLDFKGKFHALERRQGLEEKEEHEEEGGEGARVRGRNPGTVLMAEVTATAPPWFLVRALKPTGEEVSSTVFDGA
jgi:hypothetical protein